MTTGPMNFHLVDSYFNDICAINLQKTEPLCPQSDDHSCKISYLLIGACYIFWNFGVGESYSWSDPNDH